MKIGVTSTNPSPDASVDQEIRAMPVFHDRGLRDGGVRGGAVEQYNSGGLSRPRVQLFPGIQVAAWGAIMEIWASIR